jgi:hypothetical protein
MFSRCSIALLVVVAGALGALAAGMPARVHASPAAATCVTGGYSTTASKCVTVPSTGTFTIKVPKSKSVLEGSGSAGTAGTKIHVVSVSNPPNTSGDAIRVTASGAIPPLKLSKGKLYRYNAKTGKLTAVKTITKPGIYIVK